MNTYMEVYELFSSDGLRPCCGETPLFKAFDFSSGTLFAVECRKNGHIHNTGLHKTREAAVKLWNSAKETTHGLLLPTTALVTEDDYGVTRCGACGGEILCGDTGDMPNFCPACGKELDYALYEQEEQPT